jgi:CHAD domain-containing protein
MEMQLPLAVNGVSAGPWIDHLERHVAMARAGNDPEGAHQVRVAIARLRVWLTLGGGHALDDELRRLRKRLAKVRELDVMLELDPPRKWAVELRRRRAKEQEKLGEALLGERIASLLAALAKLPPVAVEMARLNLPALARQALERGKALRKAWHDADAIHALRRAVRKVRFAREWLRDKPKNLAKLQSALGAAVDRFVALAAMKGLPAGASTREYKKKLRRKRDRALIRARAAWPAVRRELTKTE